MIDNITVLAIPPTNSALGPWPDAMGKKDKAVVAVAADKGIHKCLKVSVDDFSLECPRLRLYLKSSTTIIALSISNPSAIIIPVIEGWWRGKPNNLQPNNTKKIVKGITEPTITADLNPSKK